MPARGAGRDAGRERRPGARPDRRGARSPRRSTARDAPGVAGQGVRALPERRHPDERHRPRRAQRGGVSAPSVDASTPASTTRCSSPSTVRGWGPRSRCSIRSRGSPTRTSRGGRSTRTPTRSAPSLTADRNIARHIPLYAWQGADADNPLAGFLDPTVANGSFTTPNEYGVPFRRRGCSLTPISRRSPRR